jgi:hypothetical protein
MHAHRIQHHPILDIPARNEINGVIDATWAMQMGKLVHLDLPVKPDSHEARVTESLAITRGDAITPVIVSILPGEGKHEYDC